MSIKIDGSNIGTIYCDGAKIAKVYIGSELIYSSASNSSDSNTENS